MEKTLLKWDDLGVVKTPYFWFNTHILWKIGFSRRFPRAGLLSDAKEGKNPFEGLTPEALNRWAKESHEKPL